MIARPRMSHIEWKSTEIRGLKSWPTSHPFPAQVAVELPEAAVRKKAAFAEEINAGIDAALGGILGCLDGLDASKATRDACYVLQETLLGDDTEDVERHVASSWLALEALRGKPEAWRKLERTAVEDGSKALATLVLEAGDALVECLKNTTNPAAARLRESKAGARLAAETSRNDALKATMDDVQRRTKDFDEAAMNLKVGLTHVPESLLEDEEWLLGARRRG